MSVLVLALAPAAACSPHTARRSSDTGSGPESGGAHNGVDASPGGSGAGFGGGEGTGGDSILSVRDAALPPSDAALNPDSGCEAVKDTRPQAPNVLIVLDRSRSMYVPPVDRWDPAVTAITSLTVSLDAQIRFGLMEFPSPSVSGVQGQCATGDMIVPPDLHTAGAIATALSGDPATKVGGGTPTAATLDAARQALAGLPGTSYVLLVTDGAPNCNATLDSQTCTCTSARTSDCSGAPVDGGLAGRKTPELCLDDDATVAAITALSAAGVHTFVIGYDTTDFDATLDRMAAAGGTARSTYYPVSDGAALESAFQSISGFVVSCTFELGVPPADARYVSVSIDGHRVREGTGWQLVGSRVVELVGDTCASVSDGKPHDILIVRECEPMLF